MKALRPESIEKTAEYFNDQAARTLRLVRVFDDADLAIRPGEGSMSTAEQIQHLIVCLYFEASVLKDETPDPKAFETPVDTSSVAKCVEAMVAGVREVNKAFEKASDHWNEVIEPFGPPSRGTRGEVMSMLIDHDLHHRGQLTVYARVAGKVPPVIYDPVEDEVLKSFH